MFTCEFLRVNESSAIAAIAARDFFKFLRDRSRLTLSFLVPFLLMFLLGNTVQLNLGHAAGFNFIGFTFTGVLGMTVFQSSMQGIASLLDDRQNDFAQEIFVAPVSRYSIIFGKIAGETIVAIAQTIPLVALALILGVATSPQRLMLMSAAFNLVGTAMFVRRETDR
jgi:ABC-2 type transport system permease protein